MGAIFAVPVARVRERRRAARRRASRSCAAAGEPLRGAAARCTLVVGAEREGLPDDVVAACDAVAHIPIAARVAERRDGGHGRALRVN